MTRTIDAHQHFWRYSPEEYGWISDEMQVLKRDFLSEDLVPELHRNGVDTTIAVQARDSLEETRFLLDLGEHSARIAGVVGWVDLTSPEVDAQLDEFAASEQGIVGVRHIVQDEPDDEFLLRADFNRGIERLTARGLTYDILIHPRHLSVARTFVARHPNQRFVLDHLAKPTIGPEPMQPWAMDLRDLGQHENVWCKLSGLVTEARWGDWKPSDFVPTLDVALESFTDERVMFGSDWPVCLLSAPDYAGVKGVLDLYAARLTEDERAALFGGNAAAFYLT